jgi:mRNA interferase RelE/StbE
MVKYTITFKREAIKDLKSVPSKIAHKIGVSITELAINPRPTGCIKLVGKQANFWRIRIGDYRVVYVIDDEIRIVNIRKVGHRKDIYD